MKIINPNDKLDPRPLFVTVFGHPGVGKTSLSFTMGTPLLFDFDGGMDRAYQGLRPVTVKVDDAKEFIDFIDGKKFADFVNDNNIDSVIIDTIGSLLDDYLAPYLMRLNPKNGNRLGGLSLTGWGQLSTTFNNIKNRFRELGLNICAICHAKEDGDDVSRLMRLAVRGGSADILYRVSDLIGYLYVQAGNRYIDFNPTEDHVGKSIMSKPAYLIPDVSFPEYHTFFKSVFEDCFEAMNSRAQLHKSLSAEVQAWSERLRGAKDLTEVQKIADELKSASLSKTVLAQVRKMFRDYMTEHGLVFDEQGNLVSK